MTAHHAKVGESCVFKECCLKNYPGVISPCNPPPFPYPTRSWRSVSPTTSWSCFVTVVASFGHSTRTSPTPKRYKSWRAPDPRASARRWLISCTSIARIESSLPSSLPRLCQSAWTPWPSTTTCGRPREALCQRKVENSRQDLETHLHPLHPILTLLVFWLQWRPKARDGNLHGREATMDMRSSVGGLRQKQRCVCVCVWCLRCERECQLSLLLLPVMSVGSVQVHFESAWFLFLFLFFNNNHGSSMWHFPPSYVVDVHFYMKYLLVQHCHGWELSCSTKNPSFSPEMPLLLDKFGHKRGWGHRGGLGGFMSLFSENRKQGNFVQPFRTTLLSQLQFLPVWTVESVESGWHYQFCLTRDLQKTCCSELSSSLVTGELLGYPSDIRWPFTHRGTIVYLFSRFLN